MFSFTTFFPSALEVSARTNTAFRSETCARSKDPISEEATMFFVALFAFFCLGGLTFPEVPS